MHRYAIEFAEAILDRLQLVQECLASSICLPAAESADEELGRVADFLDGDPQLMPAVGVKAA